MANVSIRMKRTASATLAIGNVLADATRPRRGSLVFFSLASESTPADNEYEIQIARCTTAGTATAVTQIVMLDPADVATELDANENHTVDPTVTANSNVFSGAANQKYPFMLYPPVPIWYPATASNGLVFRTPTLNAGTPLLTATVHISEN